MNQYVILIKIGLTTKVYGPFNYDEAIAFGKENSYLTPSMTQLRTEI